MSGRCTCDAPQTAHDVRKLRVCVACGDLALDPCKTAAGPMHARCALKLPLADVAVEVRRRARLCCLTAHCDGDLDRVEHALSAIRAFAREG